MARAVAPTGLFEARDDELGAVRELAARLISPHVASEESLRAIHQRTGHGVYVTRAEGQVTGFLAFVFVNGSGFGAICTDAFDPLQPQLEYVVERGVEPAAVYCWGIAADRPRAAAALVQGSWAARGALPATPYFVRAATDNGRRLLTRNMAFEPYPGTRTGLLWWPVFEAGRRAA
ncbi:MAG TPA: hypothetical protein VF138_11570 [Caulobacteraceae bacterium]